MNRKGREQKKTEGITQLVKALGRMRLKQRRLVSMSTHREQSSVNWVLRGHTEKGEQGLGSH